VSDMSPARRSGILCIRPDQPDVVFGRLADSGIRCAFRENAIRLAPHWYNNDDDIDRVIAVLDTSMDQ
jgi:cysteine desulfurase / selenocysteine lyase